MSPPSKTDSAEFSDGHRTTVVGVEEFDRQIRPSALSQVGQHFTEDGDKLEAVPRQPSGKRDLRILRVSIDDEMPVRAQRIETGAESARFSRDGR